jgi:2-polyprenyl-3-methyl-5-hydroxy-6-metoxy-1,4-benzoquinol methylase
MNAMEPSLAELAVKSVPNCLLCGTPGRPYLQDLRDRLFGVPGTWSLSDCPECGFIWLDPQPTLEDIGKAYQRYYTHADEDPTDRKVPRPPYLRRKIRRLYRWTLRRLGVIEARDQVLGMFLQGQPRGTLLEVGCGSGARLAALARDGWQVVGQDVDPQSAQYAQARHGVSVLVGDLQDLELGEASFDCILMNHVLEHLHDPVGVLQECLRILKPGGRLVAVTPNPRSLAARTFGAHWLALDAPRHIHLFHPGALARVARLAGFTSLETFSSVAHAELLAVQSLDIQARGRTVMGEEPTWQVERQAMAFQLREAWAFRRDPEAGEESVLIAVKPNAQEVQAPGAGSGSSE